MSLEYNRTGARVGQGSDPFTTILTIVLTRKKKKQGKAKTKNKWPRGGEVDYEGTDVDQTGVHRVCSSARTTHIQN